MRPRPPDLEDLALLVLVADTGSIGRAAAQRGLSQPSLSRKMTALERRLQVRVLDRSRRGTVVTPAGRVVVEWAAALLAAATSFEESVAALRSGGPSAVRTAMSMTVAEYLAPTWLARLRRSAPECAVSVQVANSTDVADLVAAGHVDLGFVESPQVRPGLAHREVGTDALVVAVPPAHPWAGRDRITVEELADVPLLVRELGSGTRETLDEAMGRSGARVAPLLEMASNTALTSAAVAGMGPVVLSFRAVAAELAGGALVQVAVPELDLTRPITAIWRRGPVLSPDTEALMEAATDSHT